MATTTQPVSTQLGPPGSARQQLDASGNKYVRWALVICAVLAVVGVVVLGAWASFRSLTAEQSTAMLTHEVKRSPLLITVSQAGTIESASNVSVRCDVAGGSAILWIVDDGSAVKAGDKLVELESSALEEQINQQKITVENARSAEIQAETNYAVAQLAIKEYLEGTYKQQIQEADKLVTISLENLRSAENSLDHAERMFRKGFISPLELESQQFGVKRAEIELRSARSGKEVLENFTKMKTIEDLQSQVETAKAALEAAKATYSMEETRLERLNGQFENCTIYSPTDGMVVYANDQTQARFGGDTSSSIELGARVRERQDILKIPDMSQLQVKMSVREAKVDRLRRGQKARVKVLEEEFIGTVVSVASQPNAASRRGAGINEYAIVVRIDDAAKKGLRPGLTAEVEVLVAHLEDALSLPVAACSQHRSRAYCWVQTDEGVQRRPVTLGVTNDRFWQVTDGIAEGERVVLNTTDHDNLEEEEGDEERDELLDEQFGDGPGRGRGGAGGGEGRRDAGRGGAGRGGEGGGREGGGGTRGAGGQGAGGQGGEGQGGQRRRPDGGGAGFAEGGAARGGGGARGGGPGGGLMSMDTDGDGKISIDEAPERMRDRFPRMDTNGDGFIEQAEIDALRGGGGGGDGNR